MTPQQRILDFITCINNKDPQIKFSIETSERGRNGKRCYTPQLKSGVILEVLYIRNRLVIGICLPADKRDRSRPVVIEYLTEKGFTLEVETQNLRIETDNLDEDFVKLYKLISECDLLDPAGVSGWKKIATPDQIYMDIAKICKVACDSGNTKFLDRWVFDQVDSHITINSPSETRTYREHVVPCDFLLRHVVEMYEQGSSVEDVAAMLDKNLAIAYINTEDAAYLDYVLGLRTKMPDTWRWGDSITARLDEAKVEY